MKASSSSFCCLRTSKTPTRLFPSVVAKVAGQFGSASCGVPVHQSASSAAGLGILNTQ